MPLPLEQIIIEKGPDYAGYIVINMPEGELKFDVHVEQSQLMKKFGPRIKDLIFKNMFGGQKS